jgi:hypothetical protein
MSVAFSIRIASPGSRPVTRITEPPNLGPDPDPHLGSGAAAHASRASLVQPPQRRFFQSSAESRPYASSSSAMFGADHRHDGGLRPFRHTQMAGGSYMSSKLLADFLTFTNFI